MIDILPAEIYVGYPNQILIQIDRGFSPKSKQAICHTLKSARGEKHVHGIIQIGENK